MSGTSYLHLASALAVTLGLLGAAVWLLRRMQAGPRWTGPGVPLQVLKRIPLGPKQGVALLQVGDRVLVVSIADQGARLLTELTDQAREDALEATTLAADARADLRTRIPVIGRFLAIGAVVALACSPAIGRAQSRPAAPAPRAASAATTSAAPVAAGSSAPTFTPGTRITSPAPSTHASTPAPATAGAPIMRMPAGGLTVLGPAAPQVDVRLGEGSGALHLQGAVGLVVFMGVLTLLPALFLLMTSFTRILIVLHFLRSALGTQTTPPSQLLVAIAVLLTGVVMNPVLQETNRTALQPYFQGRIQQTDAYTLAVKPFREFMLANTRDQDLTMFTELSRITDAKTVEDLPTVTIVSAFVTSELRTSFQMGFVIFLPFVIVDVIVASVLMSLGMFMLPPAMISLPFKLLLFVLADGWTLVVQNLVASFH